MKTGDVVTSSKPSPPVTDMIQTGRPEAANSDKINELKKLNKNI